VGNYTQIGKRYGRWVVTGDLGRLPYGQQGAATRFVSARCDCGTVSNRISLANLKHGNSSSCGCLQREKTRKMATRHGMVKSPEYIIWSGMRSRCLNTNDKSWHNYGGRGISVCQRWANPVQFIQDMGPKPSPNHSIDRIDNDKGYEPSNCRWATWGQQNGNRRDNVWLECQGIRLLRVDWARIVGISSAGLARRVEKWGVDKALTTPVAPRWRKKA